VPFNLSMTEIAVVLVLALVFLGPKKLPELASGLGKMIREIKKVTAGVKEDIQLDENIRKPFDELREAIQLPAAELKRRDEWKAEWEKRQADEAAQALVDAAATPTDDPTNVGNELGAEHAEGHDHAYGMDSNPDPFSATSYAADHGHNDATMISQAPPEQVSAEPAPLLPADKTIASTAPSLPPAPRLPTAPPVGAVAAGGRTMMGVVPGAIVANTPSRPTPPPPPPAAARLPAPNLPSRALPVPQGSETATTDEDKPV
jgi:TatA/E family protein of Tat protein translocase